MTKEQVEYIKNWCEIIALFIAAVWAGYTFWFEKIAEPAKIPSFLTINSEISKSSENDNFESYKARITLLNKGKTRVVVLGSGFEIRAFRYKKDTSTTNKSYSDGILSNWDNHIRFPRYFWDDTSSYKFVNVGRLTQDGVSLNPDEDHTTELVTLIPKGKFEALRLIVFTLTAKDNEGLKAHWYINTEDSLDPFILNPVVVTTKKGKTDTLNSRDQFTYYKEHDLSLSSIEYEYLIQLEPDKTNRSASTRRIKKK